MEGVQVRSVSVRLDADVATYIAKIRLAGAETDRAFGKTDEEIHRVNAGLSETDRGLTRVDAGARRVDTSMRRVDTTMSRVSNNGLARAVSRVDSLVDRLGVLPAVAIAGTSALIPLGAAAGGVAAAFAAPVAFGGGALTLFGLLDGAAIHKTNAQLQAIDSLKKRLAGLQQGTTAYAITARQLKAAQDALTPSQKRYAASLDHLHDSFDHLLSGKTGDELLGPIAQGLDLAADVLPKVTPLIDATSGSLETLLDDLGRFSQTPEFDRWIHEVASQVGPDLLAGGHILGQFTEGVGELLVVLGRRLSPELLHDLERVGDDFAQWAASRGARHDVESFVQYLHEVGPQAGHTIEAVAHGLVAVGHALAPLGPPVLRGVEAAADAIARIPTPVLTALAAATVGLTGFSKLGGFKALSFGANKLTGGKGILGGLIGATKPVPVFVVNWKGGPGGPGGIGGPGGGGLPGDAERAGKYAPLVLAGQIGGRVRWSV
jgi:hypothetical protein